VPVRGIDADVAVVGYGPVGSVLAILLAQLGRRVVVLERWPDPYPLPRAVHIDHEVARIIQSCGLGEQLRAISEPASVYLWRNGAGTTLLRFGREGAGASGWPASSMFNQPALEARLDGRARDLPGVTLRRGVEVTGMDREGDTVVLRVADGPDVRARYVVGCDGANSTVRTLAGLAVRDLGFFYDWLIVDVVLDEPRVFDPPNVQICDPARPTTAVSGGPGRRRWEFMRLPHESLEELNDEERAWALLAPWDVHRGNARLERHAVYTFNARYAERLRDGPVLVAGDAAHLMPPFAGQGMCAGIRDAANLAWKLDLVLTGRADESLLDTYEQERLPHVRRAIEFSMELGRVICVADPAEAAARDEAMAAAVTAQPSEVPSLPGLDSGLVHRTAPHSGSVFVQGAADGRLFDDVHGAGWRLVTVGIDTGAIDPAARAWFASIGGRVLPLADPDPVHVRWFAEHATSAALQRPDFHLYGTATTTAGASALLDDLRHHLTAATLQGAST
jgi:2-polyprenyl-6-methoxyphenol hydroxylase-like FAD-dependent oxidoreductase